MRNINFAKLKQRLKNGFVAALFVGTQVVVPLTLSGVAHAANEITASNHEGQLKPSGTYTNGNVTTYTELDKINFRFTVDSSAAATGTIDLVYGSGNGSCTFFQQPFTLGTYDNSAQPVVNVSGTSPSVTPIGAPVASGQEWIQTLQVNFSGTGKAVVNYNLQLTDTAGDCSGSSTHTQFGSTTGAFKNAGAQSVSIPANDIIELAQITVTKYVDDTGTGQYRTAHAGEWSFSLNGGQTTATNANGQVVFSHLQTGSNTISESSVSGYSFVTVNGTNCVAGNTSGTATATVTAATTAVNASCNFYNAHTTGSLELRKTWVGTPSQTTLKIGTTAGGTEVDSQPTGAAGAAPLTTGQNSVTTGTYYMSETAIAGYTPSIACFNDANNNGTNDSEQTVTLGANNSVALGKNQHIICTFTNTRDTGSVKVSKMVDSTGSGSYVAANPGIFTWSLDGSGNNAMGSTINNINTGSHSIGENTVSDYHFVGWYAAGDQHTCANPTGTTLPSVMVTTSQTTDITLCNAHNTGTLRVLKNVDLNGDGDYTDAGETGATNWQWQANAGVNHNTGDAAITVPTGNYALTETNQTDFHQVSLNCDGGTLAGNTVTVTNNANVVCTFVNARDTGTVSFLKTVLGGNADPNLWLFTVSDSAGTTAHSGDNRTILTGTYSVTESNGPSGYSLTGAAGICSFLNGIITLTVSASGGQCEVINTRDTGTVELKKAWVGTPSQTTLKIGTTAGGTEVDSQPTGAAGAAPLTTGQNSVTTGTYYMSETAIAGYTPSIACFNDANNNGTNDSEQTVTLGANNSVALGKNQHIICTFTNTRDTGTLQVLKNVDLNGDGDFTDASETGATNWTWTANGGASHSTGDAAVTINTGDYTLAESGPANFHFVSLNCTGGTLVGSTVTVAKDANVVCTYVNARDMGLVSFLKTVVGGTSVPADWTFNISNSTQHHSGDSASYMTGTYTVTESGPSGYSLTDVSGICSLDSELGVISMLVTTDGGQCHLTNTRDTGSVKVNKLLDNDGNGSFETTNPGTFNWSLDGSGTHTMGSTVSGVETGTHSVSENTVTNYHLVGWYYTNDKGASCSDSESLESTTLPATLNITKGNTTEITICNARDTGTITVNKVVSPSEGDKGLFNLQIDEQTAGTGGDVGNGGTTGTVTLPTGTHSVSEVAGTGTNLDDYISSFSCSNENWGNGTSIQSFTLSTNENVVCTFTNIHKATITVIKDAQPNDAQDFNFTIDERIQFEALLNNGNYHKSFTLDDDSDPALSNTEITSGLVPGSYLIHEDTTSGWTLDNISCDSSEVYLGVSQHDGVTVELSPGENVTCTFTNTRDTGTVTVKKKLTPSTDQGKFNLQVNGVTYAANVGDGGTTGEVVVPTGDVTASETAGTNTALGDYEASYNCVDDKGTVKSGTGSNLALTIAKGQNVVCTFTNNKGEILGATAPTVLVNTGNNILVTSMVSLGFITAVAGLSIATRRRNPGITYIRK